MVTIPDYLMPKIRLQMFWSRPTGKEWRHNVLHSEHLTDLDRQKLIWVVSHNSVKVLEIRWSGFPNSEPGLYVVSHDDPMEYSGRRIKNLSSLKVQGVEAFRAKLDHIIQEL